MRRTRSVLGELGDAFEQARIAGDVHALGGAEPAEHFGEAAGLVDFAFGREPVGVRMAARFVRLGQVAADVSEPRLSQGAGGLSGPALYPTVLATTRELRQALPARTGLIATGGVDSPAKAIALLEAGADAVSYFTAFVTRGPTLPRRIGEAVLAALDRRGLRRVADLRNGR